MQWIKLNNGSRRIVTLNKIKYYVEQNERKRRENEAFCEMFGKFAKMAPNPVSLKDFEHCGSIEMT